MSNLDTILKNKNKLVKMYIAECLKQNELNKDKWDIVRLNLIMENMTNLIKENISDNTNFENNFFLKENINLKNTLHNLHLNYSKGIKSDIVKNKMVDQIMMEGDMSKSDIDKSIKGILKEGFIRYILASNTPEIKKVMSENVMFNHLISKIEFI